MHAMTVRVRGRYAILLGRELRYVAPAIYMVAHEVGHVLLGHLDDDDALLEMEDPLRTGDDDNEETEADHFALALLTGTETPEVLADTDGFSAAQLARAAVGEADRVGIDPGVLALCLGHSTGRWNKAYGALKLIPPGAVDVGDLVNGLAGREIDWAALSFDDQEYLARVTGSERAS